MSEPRTKATPAPPYEGKEAWYGRWYQDDGWKTVLNRSGLPIIYMTPEAAIAAAWFAAP